MELNNFEAEIVHVEVGVFVKKNVDDEIDNILNDVFAVLIDIRLYYVVKENIRIVNGLLKVSEHFVKKDDEHLIRESVEKSLEDGHKSSSRDYLIYNKAEKNKMTDKSYY